MTKRLYTAENVLEAVPEDLDDDPDELVMEGSDSEFSDFKLEEDDADVGLRPPSLLMSSPSSASTPAPLSPLPHPSPSDTSPSSSMSSSPPPATWTSNLKPAQVKSFTLPVGLATVIPESPREVFEMFFTDDLMKLMVTESNRYAEEVMGSEKFATGMKITVDEMKAFPGFSILMEINQLPTIKNYWKNKYLHYSLIADRIPRDWFLEISMYIHFVDNSTL